MPLRRATVTVDAAGVSAGNVNISNTNGTYVFSGGPVSGSVLTKTGAGKLVLNDSNTFAAISIQGGELHASNNAAFGTNSSIVTLNNGASFRPDAVFTMAHPMTIGSNGATIGTFGTNALTISGAFAVNGPFTKLGAGDLYLGNTVSTQVPGTFSLPSNSGNVHFSGTTGTASFIASTNAGTINGDLIIDGNVRLQGQGGFFDGTGRIIVTATNAAVIATIANGTTNTGSVTNLNLPIIVNPNNLPGFVFTFGESQTNNTMIVMSKAVISGNTSVHISNSQYWGGGGGGQGTQELYAQNTYTGATIIDNANFAVERLHADNVFPVGTDLQFGVGAESGKANTSSVGGIDLNGFNQTFASLRADTNTLVNLFATAKAQVCRRHLQHRHEPERADGQRHLHHLFHRPHRQPDRQRPGVGQRQQHPTPLGRRQYRDAHPAR